MNPTAPQTAAHPIAHPGHPARPGAVPCLRPQVCLSACLPGLLLLP